MAGSYYRVPESVSFECPDCGMVIRLAERRDAVMVSPPGAKHVQYAHGRCRRRLTVLQGGRNDQ